MGGTNYTLHYFEVGKGNVTFQYQKAYSNQPSVLWMSYTLNSETNSKYREEITLHWMERYDSSASNMNEISVNYAINTNNNVVGGNILMDSFTKESQIKFHNRYWNLKEYTLEQMNEKGNKRLQEAMPLFESCLKKGDSGVTMSDLGFTKYNF